MDLVRMSTNVKKELTDNRLADSEPNASTVQAVSIASALPISREILTKVFALLAKCDASPTRNAEPTSAASNPANVFALRLTTPTRRITINVRALANATLAESTASVLHPIRPSVCANRVTLEIQQSVAATSMNAETILAVQEPCASTRTGVSSVVVPADNQATPIRYILLSYFEFYFLEREKRITVIDIKKKELNNNKQPVCRGRLTN
jgi:hypothetical protein